MSNEPMVRAARSMPWIKSAVATFDESKHRRDMSGRFADKPKPVKYSRETLVHVFDDWLSRNGGYPTSKWTREKGYAELPGPEVIQAIANEQMAATGSPDAATLEAYDKFKKALLSQYNAIMKTGLKVRAWRGEGEPYKVSPDKIWSPSSDVMRQRVEQEGEFLFFMTEKGFGSEGATESNLHPLLQMSPAKTSDGEPMLYNDLFRVVHDMVAHIIGGFSFSTRGEMNAMMSHATTLPRETWPALWAETFGQNAVYEVTGHFSEQNVYSSQFVGMIDELLDAGMKSKNFVYGDSDFPLGHGRLKRQPHGALVDIWRKSKGYRDFNEDLINRDRRGRFTEKVRDGKPPIAVDAKMKEPLDIAADIYNLLEFPEEGLDHEAKVKHMRSAINVIFPGFESIDNDNLRSTLTSSAMKVGYNADRLKYAIDKEWDSHTVEMNMRDTVKAVERLREFRRQWDFMRANPIEKLLSEEQVSLNIDKIREGMEETYEWERYQEEKQKQARNQAWFSKHPPSESDIKQIALQEQTVRSREASLFSYFFWRKMRSPQPIKMEVRKDRADPGYDEGRVKDTEKRLGHVTTELASIIDSRIAGLESGINIRADIKPGRAYAEPKLRAITIEAGEDFRTIAHEIMHVIESNSLISYRTSEFLKYRVAKSGTPEVKMNDVAAGEVIYGDHEYGNEDDFARIFDKISAAYVGKRYESGSTEVLSMGIEKLMTEPIDMMEKDPEFFAFMLGILSGRFMGVRRKN